MLARLNFNYFICVYLPGLPLALVLVLYISGADTDTSKLSTDNIIKWQYILTGYFLIMPIIIGIIIDGLRAGIFGIIDWPFSEKNSEKKFCIGHTLNPKIFLVKKECCGSESKINNYDEFIIHKVLDHYILLDYVCQFFANLFLSLLVSLIFISKFCEPYYSQKYCGFIEICLYVLFLCFLAQRCYKDELLIKWGLVESADTSTSTKPKS